MGPSNLVVLIVSAFCLALVVRNLFGAPSRFGLMTGRISILAFATFAAFFFWKARELRMGSAPSEFVWGAQRLIIAFGAALLLSAASVGVQKRKLREVKATAPAPSTSGPPAP